MSDTSAWLDAQSVEGARDALLRCCGSQRWVAGMLARRPFGSSEALADAARAVWAGLDRGDYLEAFSHHPAIGADLAELRAKFAPTLGWSKDEQSGMATADEQTLLDLQAGNQAYRDRFGYVFLICASGKSATEMLSALRRRLENDPAVELAIAAAEQAKITDLRLEKLRR